MFSELRHGSLAGDGKAVKGTEVRAVQLLALQQERASHTLKWRA
jgi:hypothetical protein